MDKGWCYYRLGAMMCGSVMARRIHGYVDGPAVLAAGDTARSEVSSHGYLVDQLIPLGRQHHFVDLYSAVNAVGNPGHREYMLALSEPQCANLLRPGRPAAHCLGVPVE